MYMKFKYVDTYVEVWAIPGHSHPFQGLASLEDSIEDSTK